MRIVSLLSSATEILFGLGLSDQVLAVSHECDYPAAAAKLPRATRSLIDSSQPSQQIDEQVKRLTESGAALYDIDRPLIRELAPDLIVTQAQCDVCAVRYQDVIDFVSAESALAATRVVALNPLSLNDILADVLRVGEAAGALPAAQNYTESLGQRIRRVAVRTGATWKGPSVDCGSDPSIWKDGNSQSTPDPMPIDPLIPRVVCLEWLGPLMAAGNWTPELIALAGGRSCLAESRRHSGYIEWGAVRTVDPQVLLIAPCGFDLTRSCLESRRLVDLPGYRDLVAVRAGRSFVIDGNAYLNRSGPRIVDSLEILAHLIRPDLFEPTTGELAEGRAWVHARTTP
jgi:iron complex transport system substrate-binding protein